LIVGETELAAKQVVIKNMGTGEQKTVAESDLVKSLGELIPSRAF
jgi:histidyl-tRNA synthetase